METWPTIEALYSPKFGRWMPHINLLWPFVTQNHFEEAIKLINENRSFQALRPFQVKLEKFGFNENSKYLFIVPDIVSQLDPAPTSKKKDKKDKKSKEVPPNPIVTIRNILVSVFPDASAENKQNFEPHLSIGQFDQLKINEIKQKLQSEWTPLEFEVNELLFITREGPNDSWRVHTAVKLHV